MQYTKLFLRFLFSGGLFTALDLVLFYSLSRLFSHEIAYLLAYSQCILLRYFWDSLFTFRNTQHSFLKIRRYITINTAVLLLGLLTFQFASLFTSAFFAKLSSIPITLASGFIFTRLWVFKA